MDMIRLGYGLQEGMAAAARRAEILARSAAELAAREVRLQVGDATAAKAAGQKSAETALGAATQLPTKPSALAAASDKLAKVTQLEQRVTGSVPLALKLPALRVGDSDVGLPHAHNHPPNLVPPNPVPAPFPSTGPVIQIPLISGATRTLIEHRPAARCGDMGLGVWCGGFFPMFEVVRGSSSVWTEGARQARMTVDVTKHCIFSAPRPSDPPLGSVYGTTVSGAQRTFVGGFPLPSFTNLAIGEALKMLFRGVGALINRIHSRVVVAQFLDKTSVLGDERIQKRIRDDLHRIARTLKGRQILSELRRLGKALEIRTPDANNEAAQIFKRYGDNCAATHTGGRVVVEPDPAGPYVVELRDGSQLPVKVAADGPGSGSVITYDPDTWPRTEHPGTTSDVVLLHELNHANNNASGRNMGALKEPDARWRKDWSNHEQKGSVSAENEYRSQRGGVPPREKYATLP
jgi:hypothetical protein